MGVDIDADWKGITKAEEWARYTGSSSVGYLRGSYFGGYSDVLREVFDCCDWDNDCTTVVTPIIIQQLQDAVYTLQRRGATRPGHAAGSPMAKLEEIVGEVLSECAEVTNIENQEDMRYDRVDPAFMRSMLDFIDLCERKFIAGLEPKIEISW